MYQFEIRSVSEFIHYIEANCSRDDHVLFRGHREDWPLNPTIARLRPRWPLLKVERAMIKAFKRRSLPFLEMRPETEWDWLAVAQHHEMPTRLLDWSVNGLASLWFAVSDPPKREGTGFYKPAVLWIFKPKINHYLRMDREPDIKNLKGTKVFVPSYVTRRIVAQGGYFTVHASADTEPFFTPLEKDPRYERDLAKGIIPAEVFPQIRYSLSRLGISSMSIYADLVGLCRDLKWRHFFAEDEPDDRQSGFTTDEGGVVDSTAEYPPAEDLRHSEP